MIYSNICLYIGLPITFIPSAPDNMLSKLKSEQFIYSLYLTDILQTISNIIIFHRERAKEEGSS